MGIFSDILDKLRRHGRGDNAGSDRTQREPTTPSVQTQTAQANAQAGSVPRQAGATTASGQAALQNVDIDRVLSELASQKGGGGNYRQSIVDLLKLLDLDSSLAARKDLAEELNVHAGAQGSAEQNMALHKAVVRKLEENGGKVPESMRN